MHPDEAAVPHGAAVDKGAVAHRDIFAQQHGPAGVAVEHRVILHVGILAKGQGAVVPAQHRPVPNARTGFQNHIAQHRGIGGHKGRAAVLGRFSTKGNDHC